MLLPADPAAARSEDARLIERLRAGDELAFEAIVARHRPRLLAFARRILRSRPDAAEDVVQEALVRAHRALLRDDRAVLLGPWLFKLTRNCALDEISRVKADTVPLDAPAAIAALTHSDGPPELHERRVSVRDMLEGIATLPCEQRHALLRREVDGASHADIASELGITSAASRSLVSRARTNLVKRDAALDARCGEVQDQLVRAYRTGRRASAHVYRHLAVCGDCRAYRGQLRAMRGALHVLHPGGLVLLGGAVMKAGLAGKGALAGAAAKSPAGVAAIAALSAAAAVGGTLVIGAGEPSPATIRSPVLPGGVVAKGAPLPPHTAVVVGAADLSAGSATVTLSCPAGHRVADLLPPGASGVTAGYVPATHPGLSRGATIALSGRPTRGDVGVAILCRVPGRDGALAAAWSAPPHAGLSAAQRPAAVTCVGRGALRSSPGGGVTGSIAAGEPLHVVGRRAGWREVATQFGATGWVPAGDLCG
jgi:RNA polymerase sigma factor (sigma-70 family)